MRNTEGNPLYSPESSNLSPSARNRNRILEPKLADHDACIILLMSRGIESWIDPCVLLWVGGDGPCNFIGGGRLRVPLSVEQNTIKININYLCQKKEMTI